MCGFNYFTKPQEASNWLQQGNLLAYPTESVWGIGCDAMNEHAVHQILTTKNRSIDKGLIVVTDSIQRIEPLLTHLTKQQREAVYHSWEIPSTSSSSNPLSNHRQATTWLLPIPKEITIPSWLTGKHNSVAVRVIAHPMIQQICSNMVSEANPFGFIISTSCNPATLKPACTLQQAQSYFAKCENIGYLQAENLGYDSPSQILDVLSGFIIR